jgi:predicted ester cyclase
LSRLSNTRAKNDSVSGALHTRMLALWPDVLAGNPDEALALISADVVDHRGGKDGTIVGIDAWRKKWEMSAKFFSNFQMIVEQQITQGELSTHRYSVRSKTASGEPFQVMGMDMIRVVDGKLVEHWALLDVTALQARMTGK